VYSAGPLLQAGTQPTSGLWVIVYFRSFSFPLIPGFCVCNI